MYHDYGSSVYSAQRWDVMCPRACRVTERLLLTKTSSRQTIDNKGLTSPGDVVNYV